MAESYPREYARTQRFSLGEPRAVTVAADGSRVLFLRAAAGDDPRTSLWMLDAASSHPTCVAHAEQLTTRADAALSRAERALRERRRERASGITAYATDPDATVAAFALEDRLYRADLLAGTVEPAGAATGVVDPRPDPQGRRIAYVAEGALCIVEDDGRVRVLAEDPDPDVTWGLAEFVAAEEMGRDRGFWWSPDGARLLAARVDERPVQRWHLADPALPAAAPAVVRYPAAGTANAEVELAFVDVLTGERTPVVWDRDALPYLAAVHWSAAGPPLLTLQTRDQRRLDVCAVRDDGSVYTVATESDPAWVDLPDGAPAWLEDGRLLMVAVRDGAYRLLVDGEPVTPAELNVRSVTGVGPQGVLFTASGEDPTTVSVWRWDPAGLSAVADEPGVHSARWGAGVTVVASAVMDRPGTTHTVRRGVAEQVLESLAVRPPVRPRVRWLQAGPRRLRAGLLLPSEHDGGPLPVLLSPYGGPGAQQVLAAHNGWLTAQWFADQGFAVLVADGAGTPGRGPAWEREIAGDLAGPVLDDQVEALHAAAGAEPALDLSRVGIRGASFGGYLAALAVLRRPEVFHAAVAFAPVTDWRLYDTHYTERYLGTPQDDAEAYRRSSLLDDAPALRRPLLLVHGLADDNVVAAHTLRLSAALLEAGRAHSVLPLSAVSHLGGSASVAENLLVLEAEFFRGALIAGRDFPAGL